MFIDHFTQNGRIHILFKGSQNKFKGNGIILSVFSDHNGIKLEMNNFLKTGWFLDIWGLNNKRESLKKIDTLALIKM